MGISHKVEENLKEGSWVRRMFEEGEQLRSTYGADRVFDFTIGNPGSEPPTAFKEGLRRLALEPIPGMHKYMNNAGYVETREAVATYLASKTGLPFRAQHIVMSCGAGGGLNVVLKTLLNPGEEVIVLVPYFVEYKYYVENHGGILRQVPTGSGFKPDLGALAQAITPRTKAVIINSPNNPSGLVYDAGSLQELGALLAAKQASYATSIYLISDEPYAKIIYDGLQMPSVFTIIKNSIVVTSHSKDLALPGERIGYIAINPASEDADSLVDGLVFCTRTLGFVNAPALMQRLVAQLQDEGPDVAAYQEKRDILYDHLSSLGFTMIKPQGAFYLFPKSPIPDDIAFVNLAKKYNILVVPGSGFGQPGYFRLSYSVGMEVVVNALPAFGALAHELGLKS